MLKTTIPILRIFDEQKAKEFYVDWLGFKMEWEHRFDDNAPLYMEVSKDNVKLHLSEHHGDATPGSRVFILCTDLKEYHAALIEKKYKYYRPGLEKAFYGCWCMDVQDPFGNRLSFNEEIIE